MKKRLTQEVICLDLKGTTKERVIAELVDLLISVGKLQDRAAALDCVLARERKMSTGMQHGIAIPHGKTDKVTDIVVALGLKKDGIEFGSLDGKPACIFVMVISPLGRTGPHIQFLAEISRVLSDRDVREGVLHAKSRREVLELLTSR